jgi:hypothetical protein
MSAESSEGGNRRGPASTDRRSPQTYIGTDGILIYGDREGRRWHVYDRRAGERRASPGSKGLSGFYRAFVNEDGEEWHYDLRSDEIIDDTAFALERQLARAVRVETAS